MGHHESSRRLLLLLSLEEPKPRWCYQIWEARMAGRIWRCPGHETTAETPPEAEKKRVNASFSPPLLVSYHWSPLDKPSLKQWGKGAYSAQALGWRAELGAVHWLGK